LESNIRAVVDFDVDVVVVLSVSTERSMVWLSWCRPMGGSCFGWYLYGCCVPLLGFMIRRGMAPPFTQKWGDDGSE